jgi:hypothetical protein
VAKGVTNITVTPTTADSKAIVKVDGLAVTSGQASQVISLDPRDTTVISILVAAQDGITSKTYTVAVRVNALPIILSPGHLRAVTAERPYSKDITADHGVPPYAFSITSGSLPSGLTLASDGKLSGTPEGTGIFVFSITATDAYGFNGTREYTLKIKDPDITVIPACLPDAVMNSSYSQVITASGGVGPYTFELTTGSLPNGITLASDGELSGIPNAFGTFTFTVTTIDGGGFAGSKSYSLKVRVR